MKKLPLLTSLALLAMMIIAGTSQSLAQGASVGAIIASDGRLTTFNTALQNADLTAMYNGNGPFTVFAPTNEAFNAIDQGILNNQNQIRQTVLYHTLQGSHNSHAVAGMTAASTALGTGISISNENGKVMINGVAALIQMDIQASNGIIHVLDAVVLPSSVSGSSAPDVEVPVFTGPPEPTDLFLGDPGGNPAFVGGGLMPHWAGIHSPSHYCKGVTWTLLKQMDGVSLVGSDRSTNPYRGDTGCTTELPMLCILKDHSSPPRPHYGDGWAGGRVRVTAPIVGSELTSLTAANARCAADFGPGWQMAEYHDGNMGTGPSTVSGKDFWAYGGLPVDTRFWIYINDKPANPWNSVNPRRGAPNLASGEAIFIEGADPAFQGSDFMPWWQAKNSGRAGCLGTTWVIHKQLNGLVQVGGDEMTNPYNGDSPCGHRLPVLCINQEGYSAPQDSHGWSYSEGWSGGWVKLSNAVSGHDIDTRDKANHVCESTFGSAWRMAEYHDGNLGTGNTEGREFWAYGNMPIGIRFWVAVNDQMANPWNR